MDQYLININELNIFWGVGGGGIINCFLIVLTCFVTQNIIFIIFIIQIPGYFSFNSRRPEKAGLTVSLDIQYKFVAVSSFMK